MSAELKRFLVVAAVGILCWYGDLTGLLNRSVFAEDERLQYAIKG